MNAGARSLHSLWRRVLRRTTPSNERQASGTRVAVELRADKLLTVRAQQDRPTRLRTINCTPAERKAVLATLRRDGWFKDARVELMLGLGQRQLNSALRPAVLDAELRDALRWQLRDALDYSPEEAVVDVLPVADTEPAGRQEVIVFTTRRGELSELLEPFHAARITLQRVATIDCAQRNLAWHACADQRPTALLLPCEGGALCTVSIGEQLILSRAIDVGTDLAPGTWRFEQTAERIAVQLQRSFDLLERRSADAAISDLVVSDWGPTAPLFQRIAGLTSQHVQLLDYQSMLQAQSQDPDGYLHLFGVCLSEAPAADRESMLREMQTANGTEAIPRASPPLRVDHPSDPLDVQAASPDHSAEPLDALTSNPDRASEPEDQRPAQIETQSRIETQTRIETLALEADMVGSELMMSPEGRPEPSVAGAPLQPPLEYPSSSGPATASGIDGLLLADPKFALAEELRNLVAARRLAADNTSGAPRSMPVDGEPATDQPSSPAASTTSGNETVHRLEILR